MIYLASAALPRIPMSRIYQVFRTPLADPVLGTISTQHMQLCPQNYGVITEDLARDLAIQFPNTAFRLHAKARVLLESRGDDASGYHLLEHRTFFQAIGRVSNILGGHGYTLHAGKRAACDLEQLRSNVLAMEDAFGMPVGVEGLYPDMKQGYLLGSWEEYAWLLSAGVRYAIDLSHLNIVATQSGRHERQLVNELLASEYCMEVHVSGNDGDHDSHQPLKSAPWWLEALSSKHPNAITFYEGQL